MKAQIQNDLLRRAPFREQPFSPNDAFADESELGIQTHWLLTPELKIDLEMILKIFSNTRQSNFLPNTYFS